jgi:hypothetical protein
VKKDEGKRREIVDGRMAVSECKQIPQNEVAVWW